MNTIFCIFLLYNYQLYSFFLYIELEKAMVSIWKTFVEIFWQPLRKRKFIFEINLFLFAKQLIAHNII